MTADILSVAVSTLAAGLAVFTAIIGWFAVARGKKAASEVGKTAEREAAFQQKRADITARIMAEGTTLDEVLAEVDPEERAQVAKQISDVIAEHQKDSRWKDDNGQSA